MRRPTAPTARPARAGRLLLVVLAATAVPLVACGDDGGGASAGRSTTTTAAGGRSTTTTAPTSTTTSGPFTPSQPAEAVWPDATTSRRFQDPAGAARSFAVDYLGFTDPVVGEYRAGDSRSGEVPVRPTATGPETTVLVRQLTDDDSWWVLGAATATLRLDTPAAGAAVASPLELTGSSTAFEGTVDVEVRADGGDVPLATGFTNGGANGEMGPFRTTLDFEAPPTGGGAVVLSTRSMEDGRLWEATVVRVRFGG